MGWIQGGVEAWRGEGLGVEEDSEGSEARRGVRQGRGGCKEGRVRGPGRVHGGMQGEV